MTTLAANKPRIYEGAPRKISDYPCASTTVIYEGAAVGLIDGTGLARALQNGDRFVGFAESSVNVFTGIGFPALTTVRVIESSKIILPITGAVVTDVGQPIYAADDDTFQFTPVGGSFLGRVDRFTTTGNASVKFEQGVLSDPYGEFTPLLKSANYTVTAADDGKLIVVDTDAVVITLPAVLGLLVRVANIGAFGTVGFTVAPNAVDNVRGPGITAADNKGLVNTKATARRGDFTELLGADADGWVVTRQRGTWARVA